jgi:hypothetical protein
MPPSPLGALIDGVCWENEGPAVEVSGMSNWGGDCGFWGGDMDGSLDHSAGLYTW